MEAKPSPQEQQQAPEVKDTPEHQFVKDQLDGISEDDYSDRSSP